jgi:hypothetical protein
MLYVDFAGETAQIHKEILLYALSQPNANHKKAERQTEKHLHRLNIAPNKFVTK